LLIHSIYRLNPKAKNSTHSRIDNLLEKFGLINRKYNGNVLSIQDEINYDKVDNIIKRYRQESLDYFKRTVH
jgi:vesicle coat complex subunit